MGQRVAVLFLSSLAWLYYGLPYTVRRLVAGVVAALMYIGGLRRDVVRANLERAFPGEDAAVLRAQIESRSYQHLAQLGFEILMLFGPMRRFVERQVEVRGVEHWQKAHDEGTGIILLSSHLGNWEIMVAAGALHAKMDLLIVTKHLKPEWLHRRIERGRRACGVSATYEPQTLKDVLGHLDRKGTIGFVLDQYSGPPVGVRVPVFGTPVGTPNVVAALSRRTGAPVLPVVNYRTPDGRFVVEIRPALEWRSDPRYSGSELANFELAANTALYASVLEEDIKAHPEQWLWIHRRFKGDLTPLKADEWLKGRSRR
ncbi:MAG: hypothetical protein A2X94_01295 [Bdellovibrionales bacterium GWB1_55_8]|nr:MAG: hypothetical protein A2X94_01295 [Bdellovibrionales bacterium GWB1_55_8]